VTSLITNDTAKSRYELEVEGHIVFADYRLQGNVVSITHVEAPEALRGKGAAGQLMQGIMEKIKAENKKVVPICSYAGAWLERHKEYQDFISQK